MFITFADVTGACEGSLDVDEGVTCADLLARMCGELAVDATHLCVTVDGEELPHTREAAARYGLVESSRVRLARTPKGLIDEIKKFTQYEASAYVAPQWADAFPQVRIAVFDQLGTERDELYLHLAARNAERYMVKLMHEGTGVFETDVLLQHMIARLPKTILRWVAIRTMPWCYEALEYIAERNPDLFREMPASIRKQRRFAVPAVQHAPHVLRDCVAELRDDRELVLSAVSRDGTALVHASERLHADDEVVRTALASDGMAYRALTVTQMRNPELALLAMTKNKKIAKLLPDELRIDAAFVRRAVEVGFPLGDMGDDLKRDGQFVLEMVARDGVALRVADACLRRDKPFVLRAVAVNGDAMRHADPALRQDRDVVAAAVAQMGMALKHAGPGLRDDSELAEAAIRQSLKAWKVAGASAKADPVVQDAVRELVAARRARREARRTARLAAKVEGEGGGDDAADDLSSGDSFEPDFSGF